MQKNTFLTDCIKAADWCSKRQFFGRVKLPGVLNMDEEEREETLRELQEENDYGDEDSPAEFFTFVFEQKKDYDTFCANVVDGKNLKVFARFSFM